jgi:hypothetical protein
VQCKKLIFIEFKFPHRRPMRPEMPCHYSTQLGCLSRRPLECGALPLA